MIIFLVYSNRRECQREAARARTITTGRVYKTQTKLDERSLKRHFLQRKNLSINLREVFIVLILFMLLRV